MGFFGLGPLLGAGVIALLAYLVFRGGGAPQERDGDPGAARRILDERYARGELTREQYEQMKRDLASG